MKLLSKLAHTLSSRLFSDKTLQAKTASKEAPNQKIMLNQAICKDKVLEAKQYYHSGFYQYELGNIETALAQYNKALTLYPSLKKVHFQRSLVLIDMGRLEKAQQDLAQATQETPSNPTILLTAGWVHLALKNLAVATDFLLNAWEQREEELASSIAINLGHIYLLQKDQEKAMYWYQRGRNSSQAVSSFYEELKEDYQSLEVLNNQVSKMEYEVILKKLQKG